MKKNWLWISIVVIILLLLGGGFVAYKAMHKIANNVMVGQKQGTTGGVFGSIQEAIMNHLSLQCSFTSDDGTSTTAYIKNGVVRVDTKAGTPEAASMIMKDKKIYFWQVAQKTGTVMVLPSITITPMPTVSEAMRPSVSPSEENGEGQNVLSMLEKFKNACKTANVADSLFVQPSDVKFTDMSEMMKQAMPSGTPSGMPSGVTQQDVQHMMQQYGAPTGY